ncbi:MAG: class I SAM-dependent RNA methyltransferase [Proteobacteria bacterium]|nr:class I SAM-dependent RNA methyltransferase [Pseudomonadota bacterium]
MTTIIDIGRCRIHSLNDEGYGVGETEKGSVAIPFSLPGEEVVFKRLRYRKKTKYLLQDIVQKSPERKEPFCQHFTQCGGCSLQHLSLNLYKEFKKSLIINALLQEGLDPFVVEETIFIPTGTRRRANFEALQKEDQLLLGFHRYKSHQIIPLDDCPLLIEPLRRLIIPLQQRLKVLLKPYQKAKIFVTYTSSGVDCSLEIQEVSELTDHQITLLKEFAEKEHLCRLTFRYRKKRLVLYQKEEPYIVFDDVPVNVDAYSFLQASTESDRILSSLILKELSSPKNIADLFSGRGTFSLPLSQKGNVEAYESDPSHVKALTDAVLAGQRPVHVQLRDLYTTPLHVDELNKFDHIILNPPRAGAYQQMSHLNKSHVSKIIYVSCSAQTFARDAKELKRFHLYKVVPVDQFVGSVHLEVIGFLL